MATRFKFEQEYPMEPDLVKLILSSNLTDSQILCIGNSISEFRRKRAELELEFFKQLFACCDKFEKQ